MALSLPEFGLGFGNKDKSDMSFIFSILTVCRGWWGGGDKDEIDNPRTILVSVSYNRQPFVHIVNSCQEMGLLLNTRHCTGYKNIDAASPQEGPG